MSSQPQKKVTRTVGCDDYTMLPNGKCGKCGMFGIAHLRNRDYRKKHHPERSR